MQIKAGLEREAEPMVDINTTPLVDVLLVLIVMLIITIPIQLHAVDLEMPGRSAPQTAALPEIVEIEVAAGGQFIWNGETLPGRARLDELLREAAARDPQPEIHLRPQARAKYDQVAQALSSAQRAGLLKLGLVGSEQFKP